MANLVYDRASAFLDDQVSSGKLLAGKFSVNGKPPSWHYWPAPNPKRK